MKTGILGSFSRKLVLQLAVASLLVHAAAAGGATTVTQVSAGYNHSLFIESDGSLWAMGDNGVGQLGDGTTAQEQDFPVLIVSSNVTAASAGTYHSCFITADNVLWGMGWNSDGELGVGTFPFTNRPIVIASNVIAVSCGGDYTLFVKSDGSLWGMGDNSEGQLGTGTYISTNRPVQILANNVVAVSAGAYTSLFQKSDGSLWSMGFNGAGQLGIGSTITKTNTPQDVQSGATFAFTAGKGSHCLFVVLPGIGRMSAMGSDFFGQLGDGKSGTNSYISEVVVPTDVSAVAAGVDNSAFIKTDGSLWAMGRNEWGQLGNCTGLSTNRPVQVLSSGVVAVSAGGNFNLFIKSDGTLWGMGADNLGQLGIGRTGDLSCVPIRIIPPLAVQITSTTTVQTNLLLHGTNDFAPGVFHVLMSTNLATPFNQWTSFSTNVAGSPSFNITVTNGVDVNSAAQRFFRLQLFQIN
jgi:alpha-tubulin suppressor-like RCC1 family protein